MAFTGKPTRGDPGGILPEEKAEDLADTVRIVSSYETPLLDHVGDPPGSAACAYHEWLEDHIVPNTDLARLQAGVAECSMPAARAALRLASGRSPEAGVRPRRAAVEADRTENDPRASAMAALRVDHAERFRQADQIRPEGAAEVMLVTAVDVVAGTITVARGHAGTPWAPLQAGKTMLLHVLGNAEEKTPSRFFRRIRRGNWTRRYEQTVRPVPSGAIAPGRMTLDETDFHKQRCLRDLLVQLERDIVLGSTEPTETRGQTPVERGRQGRNTACVAEPRPGNETGLRGGASRPKRMRGIIQELTTNVFRPGGNGLPADSELNKAHVARALRLIFARSLGRIDCIVAGRSQKRRTDLLSTRGSSSGRATIPGQCDGWSTARFVGAPAVSGSVSIYEGEFGPCHLILCRSMPADSVLLLDSSRIAVVPRLGLSFHLRPPGDLVAGGCGRIGRIVGEYTLELRNENAHGIIAGLAVPRPNGGAAI